MKRYLTALAIAGAVDAVCFMIVAPSLVFYVTEEAGGTKEQYGVILSGFSFASFCVKPFLGQFSDRHGFKIPYIFSLSVGALGGLVYYIASYLPNGNAAVGAIFVSRLLGGFGAASSALGFAYVARMIPNEQQTPVNSVLSMVRTIGMAGGPGFNALLSKVNFTLFSGRLKFNPLNSVGIVMMISNITSAILIKLLLDEPPQDQKKVPNDAEAQVGKSNGVFFRRDVIFAIISPGILIPCLIIFSFNSCFQLIETGFVPAVFDALGWRTVQTSAVLGSVSFVIMFNMFLVSQLSSRFHVSDPNLLIIGLTIGIFGYLSIYTLWVRDADIWHFVVPFILAAGSFPFLAAPNRSLFTKMMNEKEALEEHHGLMQAVLSMIASLAGFVTPAFVAKYILRTTEEVDESIDKKELTAWALYAPVLLLISLASVGYLQLTFRQVNKKGSSQDNATADATETKTLNETSALLLATKEKDNNENFSDPSQKMRRRSTNSYNHKVAMHRQSSTACMGLTHHDGHIEHNE